MVGPSGSTSVESIGEGFETRNQGEDDGEEEATLFFLHQFRWRKTALTMMIIPLNEDAQTAESACQSG